MSAGSFANKFTDASTQTSESSCANKPPMQIESIVFEFCIFSNLSDSVEPEEFIMVGLNDSPKLQSRIHAPEKQLSAASSLHLLASESGDDQDSSDSPYVS